MNWFERQQIKNIIKTASYYSPKEQYVTHKEAEMLKKALDWKGQEGEWITFGDVGRYVMDAYSVKLFLSKTNRGWTISLMTNHAYLGTAQYAVFWRFSNNEEKKAREIYRKINDVVKKTCKEFIAEEKPTVLFDPTLRSRVQDIEDPDLVRTNIPVINYSYRINYEPDWDRNIYGPRYPSYKEVSFKQYLNSSIYKTDNPPTGKFAL